MDRADSRVGGPPTEPFVAVVAAVEPILAPQVVVPQALHVRLFGSHAYFRLWLDQVVSSLGDWVGFVAIVAIAQRIGGGSGAGAIGLVMTARILPGFFLSQLAGVIVDRLDRKKVMICCDVGRGLVLCSLPFINSVLGLVVASFLLEVGTLMWSPAKEAIVPNLVPAEHLTSANSLSLAAAYGTFPLATILFTGLTKLSEWMGHFAAFDFLRLNSESIAIYFDVLTFFLSAALIATLPILTRVHDERGASSSTASQVLRDLREGWRVAFRDPIVRGVLLCLGPGLIGGGMLVPLGPVFAKDVLHGGPAAFGLLLSALGFGVAACVLALSFLQRRLRKVRSFTLAAFMSGASLMLAASSDRLGPSMAFVFVLGIGAGAVYVLGFTVLQESVHDDMRGRIFSTLYTLVRLCLLLAFAVGPFMSDLLDRLARSWFHRHVTVGITVNLPGVRLTLWLAGLIILLSGLIALASFRRGSPTGRVRDLP
jgi:dTMP kinase